MVIDERITTTSVTEDSFEFPTNKHKCLTDFTTHRKN